MHLRREYERSSRRLVIGRTSSDPLSFLPRRSNDPPIHLNSLSPTRRPPGIPTNGGPPLLKLEGHTSIVYSLALLPPHLSSYAAGPGEEKEQREGRESLLVSSSEDGTVRIWDPNPHYASEGEEERRESRLVATIPHPITTIWSVDVLPTSRDIVSGGEDGMVRVFTLSGKENEEEGGWGVTKEEREEYDKGCEEVAKKTGRLG